jgi:hypothetical protein
VVESQPSKLLVAGSIPVSRSKDLSKAIGKPPVPEESVLSSMYQQPVLPISDPQTFNAVKGAIEASFASGHVAEFLKSLERSRLRIRDFEDVLGKGNLGASTAAEYSRLGNADQGQIRELYLASLEQVAPELREKFFKLYAYY